MTAISRKAVILLAAATFALTACSTKFQPGRDPNEILDEEIYGDRGRPRSTIWDFFAGPQDRARVGRVNKYIWNASLEVLDFLPVESVDPFTGVIVTGYGTPPGGGRAYRATIFVKDPALDARSLNLALQTRSGPVSADTARAIEDAILTRARQLRAVDSKL
ncbi:DUF3576 domain-containing protein [Marinovum sp. 2_MG-2023]|uniref:DUF3576 domain-containing protein n=1 Tax=Roseobacteraceae TaxID=2854170 RepID=UPI001FD5279F|nr:MULTISPECIES: DUF3576 domain-containing protein [Roseobacteraceae]MCJ7874194.1 DUF3576 domain-containing protein [Phaeobacter sp. J2-8]MDO6730197.1 DUF3576 domain-containing protein [Marinovum sp. 2_MG-2023]MDO6778935.1 DUF3576 domain-containing protein [Marinovum sp. 1_MG-2023]